MIKKVLYSKKVYTLILILLFTSCNSKEVIKKDELVVDSNILKIEYVNFLPKSVNKECLSSHIKSLINAIKNNELERQKHISYVGNHEWKKITASHYLRITDKKDALYIMFSIEPMVLILLDKPYEKLNKDYQDIGARWLKKPIDLHECIED